jgi:hypothetical protein
MLQQRRSYYSLADLPADQSGSEAGLLWPTVGSQSVNEAIPQTLASIPVSRFSDGLRGNLVHPLAPLGLSPDRDTENFAGAKLRTAFVQGLNAFGDSAQIDAPIAFTVGNEIKPVRPGRPIKRHQLDTEYERIRMWPPVQIDLPRFKATTGVPQRLGDLFKSPGLEDRMMEVIVAGKAMMGGADWYDTDEIRKKFVRAFGHNAGTVAFYDFMKFVAVASPGSDVGTSIRNASRNFNMFRRGEPLPEVGDEVPPPYGHRWAGLLRRLAKVVAEEGELDPVRYPKITSFFENLAGNRTPVTIDIHALRLPAMLARDENFLKHKYREKFRRGEISMDEAVANPSYWRNPYPNEYGPLEQFYKKLAERANMLPAEAQGAAWLGGGDITGLKSMKFNTFMEHFNDRIRRTSEKWGLSEEEVWDKLISGEIDLVSREGQKNIV